MSTKKKIVTIGGGTGTYTALTGLKAYADTIDITAIVSIADNGGSTGRLIDHFGKLPVGDVRMALSALASHNAYRPPADAEQNIIRELLKYRFDKGEDGLRGHNLGNLFLVALSDMLGSEAKAIEKASEILNVCGTVLPVSEEKTTLVATYSDGSVVSGEAEIDCPSESAHCPRIVKLSVDPVVPAYGKALDAITSADLILFGPGDLYTSIIPNLLIDGVKDAIASSSARSVYAANLMTKYGQTDGMSVAHHVNELASYAGRHPDTVIINCEKCSDDLLKAYEAKREYPTIDDYSGEAIRTHLLAKAPQQKNGDAIQRSLVRHKPDTLASTILSLISKH